MQRIIARKHFCFWKWKIRPITRPN